MSTTIGFLLFATSFVGVWMMYDWYTVERHQPFPDEEDD
jgi:hypothetical protein